MQPEPGQVTQILDAAAVGDPEAAEKLLPLVYDELRKLAAARMALQPAGQTLQATALVHEAWMRWENRDQQSWKNRRHFFAAASQAMRHILIELERYWSYAKAWLFDHIAVTKPKKD